MTKPFENIIIKTVGLHFHKCIIKKFLNKIHMSKQHSATAISFQTQCIKSITETLRKRPFYE
ncbi:hypothetical protein V1477_013773, partial [Vespula maculifrons]